MVEQIRRFRTKSFVALANAGDHRLDGFLTELLGAALRTRVEKLPRIGFVGRGSPPAMDRRRQPGKNVVAHFATLEKLASSPLSYGQSVDSLPQAKPNAKDAASERRRPCP
jgi:hypothetical protein